MSIEECNRVILHDRAHGHSKKIVEYLDKYYDIFHSEWAQFDEERGYSSRYAVDLVSGTGYYAFEYEKHFRERFDEREESPLQWFPSERPHRLEVLKQSLLSWQRNFFARSPRVDVLFPDANGRAVYPNDGIFLKGLQKKPKLNGSKGTVVAKDTTPGQEGRIKVKLASQKKPISVKPINLVLDTEGNIDGDYSKIQDPNARLFIQDLSYEEAQFRDMCLDCIDQLFSWAIPLDIADMTQFSWDFTIRDKIGKCSCALVTYCPSPFTADATDQPGLWKNVLKVAFECLSVGGYLIMHDMVDHQGGYGDEDIMRSEGLLRQKLLEDDRMELVEVETFGRHDGRDMVITVWRKAGSVATTITLLNKYKPVRRSMRPNDE